MAKRIKKEYKPDRIISSTSRKSRTLYGSKTLIVSKTEQGHILTTTNIDTTRKSSVIVRILGVVLLLILMSYLFTSFRNGYTTKTFTSLLEFFTTIEVPDIPFISIDSLNLSDWGVFNFLKEIINFLFSLFNLLAFLLNGLLTLGTYVVTFCSWLFS